jgi:replicative DNA helicase
MDEPNEDDEDTGEPIETSIPSVNKALRGWKPTELVTIAARPGMGKSAYAMWEAYHAAIYEGEAVAIFSLEMSSLQVLQRLICSDADVPLKRLKERRLSIGDKERLMKALERASEAKLYIDDSTETTLADIRTAARTLRSKHGKLGIILVDYLQLINSGAKKGHGNRTQEISETTRGLKKIALNENCTVIELSQLSRSVDQRGGDRIPMLSDLRESGSIEQDSDVVVFLYRPEYYNIKEDEDGNSTKGLGSIIVAKNRDGATSSLPVKFNTERLRFTERDIKINFDSFTSTGFGEPEQKQSDVETSDEPLKF